MKKINVYELYKLIMNNLDDWEIEKNSFCNLTSYTKFYCEFENLSNTKLIISNTVTEFLLYQLFQNYGKMISIEKLEEWLTLSTFSTRLKNSRGRYKYEKLVEILKNQNTLDTKG